MAASVEERRAWQRAYYLKNREKLLSKSKAWQKVHPEQGTRWRKEHASQHKDNLRRQRYGISGAEFRELVESQDGLCRICMRVMDPPHVDHDHETGHIRGLLCDNCNRGLGHLQEDPAVLEAAIDYLKERVT